MMSDEDLINTYKEIIEAQKELIDSLGQVISAQTTVVAHLMGLSDPNPLELKEPK